MKKRNLFLGMFAMTSMLFVTSCSQDELVNNPAEGDYITAQFTIDTPDGIATRATIGNGTKADVVTCAVFDEKGTEMSQLRQTVNVSDKKATYSIRLVKGQEYRIAFFAYNQAASAYDVTDMKNIKVNANQACNIENRDAFTAYTVVTAEESMQSIDRDVTLYRPFAQLNLGAYKKDIEAAAAAGVVVTNSQIKVSNVYTAFNAYDDVVTGETSEVTFAMNGIPTEDLEVDINEDETISDDEKFEYLALNYLLVGDLNTEKSLTDVEFVWKTADNKTNNPTTVFKNIPVQRNYRTNIIGYLLTNPAQFNIFIDEEFQKPDYIVYGPWDGKEISEPQATATEYLISSPAEWVWLKDNKKAGMNIKLTANLDFGGNEVKGLGFTGEFDGQGYTMSNMTLLCGGSYYSNGLFQGDASIGGDVTVKNVTIENVVAECAEKEFGYVGAIFGDIQNGITTTLENVHVKNADFCGVQGVGGLIGFVTSATTLNIANCSVENSHLYNYAVPGESGQVASFVGKVVGTVNFTDDKSTSTNNVIEGYYDSKRKETSIQEIAATDGNYGYGTITGMNKVTATGNVVTKMNLDDMAKVSSSTELGTAISAGKTNITLAAGTYQIPAAAKGKTLTLNGSKDAVIEVVPAGQGEANGQLDYNLEGSTVTFNNLTIKTNSQLYAGYARLSGTYNNCIIQNTYNLGTGNSAFKDCTFNITNEYLRVGGASTAKFEGCTFNTDGRAILVFQDGTSVAQTVTVKDCTFNATAAANTWNGIHVAAVSIDGTNGTYVVNLEGTNTVDSDFNGLWQIKTGEANVTVNE